MSWLAQAMGREIMWPWTASVFIFYQKTRQDSGFIIIKQLKSMYDLVIRKCQVKMHAIMMSVLLFLSNPRAFLPHGMHISSCSLPPLHYMPSSPPPPPPLLFLSLGQEIVKDLKWEEPPCCCRCCCLPPLATLPSLS